MVVQVGFEKSAKEAGKGILEGVGKLMGNPTVKKLEAESDTLKNKIADMKVEKETIQQQAKFIISQKEKEIAEKISSSTHNNLN